MEKITYVLDRSPLLELLEGFGGEECITWMEMHEHDFRAKNYIFASINNEL